MSGVDSARASSVGCPRGGPWRPAMPALRAVSSARSHAPGGSRYAFLASAVLSLDPVNPQLAAGGAACMANWARLEPRRLALLRRQLQRLAAAPQPSPKLAVLVAAMPSAGGR